MGTLGVPVLLRLRFLTHPALLSYNGVGGGVMLENVSYAIICALAVYGLVSLVTYIFSLIRQKARNGNHGIRLVMLVKNQAEDIEGIVRNIYEKDLLRMAGLPDNLTIIDMSSGDETAQILERLGKQFGYIDILYEDDYNKLLLDFRDSACSEGSQFSN